MKQANGLPREREGSWSVVYRTRRWDLKLVPHRKLLF